MELALILVIVLQLAYSAYKDALFSKEREKLELKLMSRSTSEYISSITPDQNENTPVKDDPYIDIYEASIEQILKTKDTI